MANSCWSYNNIVKMAAQSSMHGNFHTLLKRIKQHHSRQARVHVRLGPSQQALLQVLQSLPQDLISCRLVLAPLLFQKLEHVSDDVLVSLRP